MSVHTLLLVGLAAAAYLYDGASTRKAAAWMNLKWLILAALVGGLLGFASRADFEGYLLLWAIAFLGIAFVRVLLRLTQSHPWLHLIYACFWAVFAFLLGGAASIGCSLMEGTLDALLLCSAMAYFVFAVSMTLGGQPR